MVAHKHCATQVLETLAQHVLHSHARHQRRQCGSKLHIGVNQLGKFAHNLGIGKAKHCRQQHSFALRSHVVNFLGKLLQLRIVIEHFGYVCRAHFACAAACLVEAWRGHRLHLHLCAKFAQTSHHKFCGVVQISYYVHHLYALSRQFAVGIGGQHVIYSEPCRLQCAHRRQSEVVGGSIAIHGHAGVGQQAFSLGGSCCHIGHLGIRVARRQRRNGFKRISHNVAVGIISQQLK